MIRGNLLHIPLPILMDRPKNIGSRVENLLTWKNDTDGQNKNRNLAELLHLKNKND